MADPKRDQDETEAPEPTPVTPGPVSDTPSSTGVVAGDGDEPREATTDGRE